MTQSPYEMLFHKLLNYAYLHFFFFKDNENNISFEIKLQIRRGEINDKDIGKGEKMQ